MCRQIDAVYFDLSSPECIKNKAVLVVVRAGCSDLCCTRAVSFVLSCRQYYTCKAVPLCWSKWDQNTAQLLKLIEL